MNNILKICSFYVSDWHLTAMLLPYIEEAEAKGEHLNTILEKNISYNMTEILSRIKMSERKKEERRKVGWENQNLIKYGAIKKYMENATKNQDKVTIIIEGSRKRIEYINSNINKWAKKSEKKIKHKEIKIINCYEVTEFNQDLNEILSEHDKILNTSGIHEIEEMYAGYIKKRA